MDRNVLIYCRISRDDGLENYEKIETQRDILINYCLENELGKISEIILHDNISGRDNSRFDYLKKVIKQKNIHCVVIKDLSRLGRDLVHSLDFMNYLENNCVELIFSHESRDKNIYPLISWFNQQRAKEDSQKIKKSMYFKMEKGDIIFNPPYGYKIIHKNLEKDIPASKTVEQIFELFTSGCSIKDICRRLEQSEFINEKWSNKKVLNILQNDFYCGTGKFGTGSIAFNEPVIIENHHLPIIEKELFNQAQLLLKLKRAHRINDRAEGLFSGIIYCGRCGSKMYLRKSKSGNFYICNEYNKRGKSGCTMHKVLEGKLYIETEKYLMKMIGKFIGSGTESHSELSKEIEKNLEKNQHKMNILISDYENNYIDSNIFEKKQKTIEQKIEKILNINEVLINKNYSGLSLKLERSFIAMLFDKIIVFEPGEIRRLSYPALPDPMYNSIYCDGGILFIENPNL